MSWVGWRCQRCRHEFKDNQRFCPQCGYTVYDPIQAEERPDWVVPQTPTALAATATPTAYQVSCLPLDHSAARHLSVWVKWRGENRWAVTDGGMQCLSRDGQWVFEPQTGVIQELVAAARHATWCIPDGLIPSRGLHQTVDGFEVKTRLKAAVQAAREALTPKPTVTAVAESVHPGEILREELKARGLTQLACAELMGRSARVVNRIIRGRQSIIPDTALDLERALGVSAGFWVRLQADHDLRVARQRRG